MKIVFCVLAALVFGTLSTTAGLAEQRANVPDKSARSGPEIAAVSQPAQNRDFNLNGTGAGTVAGRTNANEPGPTNGRESLSLRRPAGSIPVRQPSAAGPLNHAGISGTNLVRTGSGPAVVGGPTKNVGSINGTTFGQKHH